ncbi:MAG: TolC family outer membrane protein [Hyphomicrobiaceae bacterium]
MIEPLDLGCHALRCGRAIRLIVISGLALAATVQDSRSDTLAQALASAYKFNPTLLAERKRLQTTDEGVPQAKSGYRPRVIASGNLSRDYTNTRSRNSLAATTRTKGSTTPHGYQIEFTQSLFRGFRTVNAVKQAEANVLAARENLRSVEQSVLLDAVTAYMDVMRDRAIVLLREKDVGVLTSELRAVEQRFNVGDVTRTDVAQAMARRARSLSTLNVAKSDLKASEAAYVRVIGHAPDRLHEPRPPQRRVPGSLPEAIDIALSENPAVVRAAFLELAAQHEVDVVRGELLPELNLEGSYANQLDNGLSTKKDESASIGGRLTIPLYQGGDVYSRIRAAKRTRERLTQEIDEARNTAKAEVITAWSVLVSARARLASTRVQVDANRTALAGVRAEEAVGQRNLLDVLDAEQELLSSETDFVTTRRDLVVAFYGVVSAMGRLTADHLNLGTDQHDPEEYYEQVKNKPWGTTVTSNEDYDGYTVTQ